MRIAAFDPSSSRTGFAIAETDPRPCIVVSGLIKPATQRGGVRLDYWARTLDTIQGIRALFEEQGTPDVVAVEAPGRNYSRKNQQNIASMVSYFAAFGAIAHALTEMVPRTRLVSADDWTRMGGGRAMSKASRLQLVRYAAPTYDPAKDTGGDEGDAILLADWFARRLAAGGADFLLRRA